MHTKSMHMAAAKRTTLQATNSIYLLEDFSLRILEPIRSPTTSTLVHRPPLSNNFSPPPLPHPPSACTACGPARVGQGPPYRTPLVVPVGAPCAAAWGRASSSRRSPWLRDRAPTATTCGTRRAPPRPPSPTPRARRRAAGHAAADVCFFQKKCSNISKKYCNIL
jgi:hypothetical protein